MHFINSANRQRAAIFDEIQASAVECAKTPGFVAEVGAHAMSLTTIVEQAYPLNVHLGTVTVPRRERDADNVGVVVADSQLGAVNASNYFASLPATEVAKIRRASSNHREAGYMKYLAGSGFYKSGQNQALQVDGHPGGRHVCVTSSIPVKSANAQILVRSRSLISFGADVIQQTPAVKGSIFLHEADHTLFTRTMVAKQPELYVSTDVSVLKTMKERSAHFVSFTALKHMGAYEGFPDFEELETMERQAGSMLLECLSENDENALKFPSYWAMVLTRTYGSLDGTPSEQEVFHYENSGIIR